MSSATRTSVIPVIDLMGGQVVRAVRGDRSNYRPLESPLAPGGDALALARALLDHPACSQQEPILYVADLDAIQGRGANVALLQGLVNGLAEGRPAFRLWLDGGFDSPASAASTLAAVAQGAEAAGRCLRPVYGSESLRSLEALAALSAQPEAILSLDCRLDQALDPAGCWQQPALWPDTLIVMTLDRVGAHSGPDLATFDRLRAQAGGRRMVGAGGLRSAADLALAHAAGAAAWLVATALHDGSLGPGKPST